MLNEMIRQLKVIKKFINELYFNFIFRHYFSLKPDVLVSEAFSIGVKNI